MAKSTRATSFFKSQFSAGEITPSLYARIETTAYQSGAKRLRNFFVKPHGGVANRSGLEFVGQCRSILSEFEGSSNVRLIPFKFSEQDSYVLEFGHLYMRVIRDGGYVLKTDISGAQPVIQNTIKKSVVNVTSATKANPCVITTNLAHNFSAGSPIHFSPSMGGMTQLADVLGYVLTTPTATTFTFSLTPSGTPVDSSSYSTYTSGGFVYHVGITNSDPAVFYTEANHGYQDGDHLLCQNAFLNDDAITTEYPFDLIDNKTLVVATHTANSFTLKDMQGYPINTSYLNALEQHYKPYTPAQFFEIFTKSTTYSGDELAQLKFVQSGDLMTIVHPNHVPRSLKRQGHAVWSLEDVSFGSPVPAPSAGLSGKTNKIVTRAITGITKANPAVLNMADLSPADPRDPNPDYNIFRSGGVIAIPSATGMPEINNKILVLGDLVTTTTEQKFNLQNLAYNDFDTTTYANVATGGTVIGDTLYRYVITSVDILDRESLPSDPILVISKAMSALIDAETPYVKITLKWTSVAEASYYKIYRQKEVAGGAPEEGATYGYIGKTKTTTFVDQNISPDFTQVPATALNPFYDPDKPTYTISAISNANPAQITLSVVADIPVGSIVSITDGTGLTELNDQRFIVNRFFESQKLWLTSYITGGMVDSTYYGTYNANTAKLVVETTGFNPITVGYYQQRRVYGGSQANPQTVWFSSSGDYDNFNKSNPLRDSDSLDVVLSTQQINVIKHIIPMASLLVMTAGGCFKISGEGAGSVITPKSIQAMPQTYTGCSDVQPVILNSEVIYNQYHGSGVYALGYDFYKDSFSAQDLMARAKHLLDGYTIKEWAYSASPDNIVYVVRSDGTLLMLSYLRDVEVVAWSWGDSLGNSGADRFESVCVISENGEDVPYFVVRRFIQDKNGGSYRKYVERLKSRNLFVDGVPDPNKCFFVDSGVYYNTGDPINIAKGLDHLDGCTVSILADGNVLPQQVVVNGQITLEKSATTLFVGLPYKSELITLPLEIGSPIISPKRKKEVASVVRVFNTRGIKMGMDEATAREFKQANQMDVDSMPLFTGDLNMNIGGSWDTQGSVYISQEYPLPAEILGVILDISIGDDI